MKHRVCLLLVIGLLEAMSAVLRGQEAQTKYVNATFQSLLARVAERDSHSKAILKIKPTKDETSDDTPLNFSIEKLPNVSEALVIIASEPKTGEATNVFEQYRLKIDDAIQQELKNHTTWEKDQEEKWGIVLLKVKHLNQDINLCCPTSAAMALDFYGESRDPHDLKTLATPPDSTFEGTYFKDMVAGVAKIGYHWIQKSYPVTGDGFLQGLQGILVSLRQHHPVLVDLFVKPVGHTVLVVGCDERSQQVFYLDPNRPSSEAYMYTYEEFSNNWHSTIAQTRGAIYTAPKEPGH